MRRARTVKCFWFTYQWLYLISLVVIWFKWSWDESFHFFGVWLPWLIAKRQILGEIPNRSGPKWPGTEMSRGDFTVLRDPVFCARELRFNRQPLVDPMETRRNHNDCVVKTVFLTCMFGVWWATQKMTVQYMPCCRTCVICLEHVPSWLCWTVLDYIHRHVVIQEIMSVWIVWRLFKGHFSPCLWGMDPAVGSLEGVLHVKQLEFFVRKPALYLWKWCWFSTQISRNAEVTQDSIHTFGGLQSWCWFFLVSKNAY